MDGGGYFNSPLNIKYKSRGRVNLIRSMEDIREFSNITKLLYMPL